jgi:hypothetical protein
MTALLASSLYCWSQPNALLDTPMPQFRAAYGAELLALCRALNKPCGYERPQSILYGKDRGPELHLNKKTPREILGEIIRRHPGHRWSSHNGVLTIEGDNSVGPDLLARKIDRVSIHGRTSFTAAHVVFAQAKIRVRQLQFGNLRYAHIDLELRNVTVREALNAIAKADGQVMWFFTAIDREHGVGDFSLVTWHKTGFTDLDFE